MQIQPLPSCLCAALAAAIALGATLAAAHMGATGVVKERMELMKTVANANKSIRDMVGGKETLDITKVASAAKTIAEHGTRIAALFPAGTGGGVSEAAPKIWEDPDGFKARADATVKAARALEAAAKLNDLPAVSQASRALGRTCSGCHRDYRIKKSKQ